MEKQSAKSLTALSVVLNHTWCQCKVCQEREPSLSNQRGAAAQPEPTLGNVPAKMQPSNTEIPFSEPLLCGLFVKIKVSL